ncbi:MAG: DMT family transporter [Candidatus Eremiobacteraeota bacterium]|nr:DMT family transporter [Candidatus Eremiobacteraeota bacterium]
MSRSLKAHLLLLAVVFVWGSTFVVVKGALADISPLLFNLLRMLLATLSLALLYWRHIGRVDRKALAAGAVTGLWLATGYQFQTAGLRLTTPSKSAFITGLVVVLVPLLLVIPRLRPEGTHAPRWNVYVGALLAFGGILLLTMPADTGLDFKAANSGDLLSLGCAVGFAFHMLALAHFSPRVCFEQLAVLQVGFAAVFMGASLRVFEHPFVHWTPRVLVALLIAAVLATAAAFTIQSWAQQFIPATHTALIFTLEPVFAWLTSFVVLGERLGVRSTVGAGLILTGIGFTELLPERIQPTAHETAPLGGPATD